MHLVSVIFPTRTPSETSFVINNHVMHDISPPDLQPLPPPPDPLTVKQPGILPTNDGSSRPLTVKHPKILPTNDGSSKTPSTKELEVHLASELPMTSIVHHAPGYTIFRNLYMSNGTLFIVSPNRSFPEIRMMASVSMFADGSPENIAAREPNIHIMDFLTPENAKKRWGGDVNNGARNSVFTVEGNTVSYCLC